MRCLYCDRPLALLKRLTGDGEFCSKEHRKIYQQEHNQLALARLLESKPNTIAKARPAKVPEAQTLPTVAERAKPVQKRGPEPAGFVPDLLQPVSFSRAVQTLGAPRFANERPTFTGGLHEAGRPGPQPKAADFLSQSHQARFIAAKIRPQGRYVFRGGAPELEEKGSAERNRAMHSPQPASAGFTSEEPVVRTSPGTARPSAGPQFRPLAAVPAKFAQPDVPSGGDPKLRPGQFQSGLGLEQSMPSRIRESAMAPRWQPLLAALPKQQPGKIVLVLGSFLQRPVRLAGQDRLPENFDIPFRPVPFATYSPQMGCLEQRLHRTDRIGFSPP